MGFKETLQKKYTDSFIQRNGDRITQVQGNVISIKIETKSILWIFNKLMVTLVIKPEASKSIVKCVYRKNRWFKKPSFMPISQGHRVIVMGLKGKKGKEDREIISIMNVMNLSNKKDLIPTQGGGQQSIKKVQKVQRR